MTTVKFSTLTSSISLQLILELSLAKLLLTSHQSHLLQVTLPSQLYPISSPTPSRTWLQLPSTVTILSSKLTSLRMLLRTPFTPHQLEVLVKPQLPKLKLRKKNPRKKKQLMLIWVDSSEMMNIEQMCAKISVGCECVYFFITSTISLYFNSLINSKHIILIYSQLLLLLL